MKFSDLVSQKVRTLNFEDLQVGETVTIQGVKEHKAIVTHKFNNLLLIDFEDKTLAFNTSGEQLMSQNKFKGAFKITSHSINKLKLCIYYLIDTETFKILDYADNTSIYRKVAEKYNLGTGNLTPEVLKPLGIRVINRSFVNYEMNKKIADANGLNADIFDRGYFYQEIKAMRNNV